MSPQAEANDEDIPFHRFLHLPQELQIRILTLACRSPTTKYVEARLRPDLETTLALLCVARRISNLIIPIHYSNIRIDRPSTLRSVYGAVLEHPERGKMIKSLHLGPNIEMSSVHWPLELYHPNDDDGGEEYAQLWMRTSLQQLCECYGSPSRYNDEDLAPQWHEVNWEVCFDAPPPGCRGRAAYDALITATLHLNVDPYRRAMSVEGQIIGLAEWSRRIFEVRAALDIYLIEMRRVDDERGYLVPEWRDCMKDPRPPIPAECERGTCGHVYPRLLFTLDAATGYTLSPEPGATFYYITQLQISRHMSKAHGNALTDRFEHPLVFARSGWPLLDADVADQGQELIGNLLCGPHSDEDLLPHYGIGERCRSLLPSADEVHKASSPEGPSHPTTDPDLPGAGDAAHYLRALSLPLNASDEPSPNTETLAGFLTMARVLLALAPALRNLSLTGVFHRLLCGQTSLPLGELKCLSIGPVLPYWTNLFNPGALVQLVNVEQLRICSTGLSKSEIDVLAGTGHLLPRLKQVSWECVELADTTVLNDASVQSFVDLAQRLEEVAGSTSFAGSGTAKKRTRVDYEESRGVATASATSATATQVRRAPRNLEVHVHEDVLPILMAKAPSPTIGAAWKDGAVLSDFSEVPIRLKVVESIASRVPKDYPKPRTIDRLYRESKRWWEKCAIECGIQGW